MGKVRTAAVLLLVAAVSCKAQTPSSLKIDQTMPYLAGAGVTFTSVYPKDARQGGRTPQFPIHPQAQLDCVGFQTFVFDPEGAAERNNGDGTFTGNSLLVELPPGPTQCTAALYNFTEKQGQVHLTVYYQLAFDVVTP